MRSTLLVLVTLIPLAMAAIVLADGHAEEATSGQAVFETSCANCHTGGFGGFFTGAPDIDDKDDWESLTPKGVDGLTATTIAGIGKMEPRGACANCSDADIRAAVEYMLKKSQ
jgi:cytochrome c5